MICPDCNKKIRHRHFNKGKCKCGYTIKYSDYIRVPCTYQDICNDGVDCWDDDWKHCGGYINIKKMFDYNRAREIDKIISD